MLMFAFLDILRAQILAVEIHLHGAYLACSYPGPCMPLDKRLIRFFSPFSMWKLLCSAAIHHVA